jgi:uncharacterized HhH-GPD family protein
VAHQLHLTGDEAADRMLSDDPLALVIGMLLDQQFPMERAFAAPAELARRLGVGHLDAVSLATMDPDRLAEAFAERPALHRYPGSMAGRVAALSKVVADRFEGDASRLWSTASTGDQLVDTLTSLPGFGTRKAKIFAALLGKQLGVRPRGWRQASDPYGTAGTRLSIADVVGPESLAEVRSEKQRIKRAAAAASTGRRRVAG